MSDAQVDLRVALPIGTLVGDYELEALLGHGGYSVVYRARHVELGHVVALKEYLPIDFAVRDGVTVFPRSTECAPHYEEGRHRFLEEAKRIVQFKDEPGVVAYLGFFRANGTAYLVLEHVDGMSLAALLRQREGVGRPLDENELRSLVLPLLKTLSSLHAAGVLHRDIKPSNILVRRSDGRPVLIDFGAAKQEAALHSKSAAPFTPGYAALEQVGEGHLGHWTDVYAIGAVMWRIVAGGRPPWNPPDPKKVELRASAVLTGQPDPLPSAVDLGKGRFSPNLLVTVDECLRIRATERIPSSDALRMAIETGASNAGPIIANAAARPTATSRNSIHAAFNGFRNAVAGGIEFISSGFFKAVNGAIFGAFSGAIIGSKIGGVCLALIGGLIGLLDASILGLIIGLWLGWVAGILAGGIPGSILGVMIGLIRAGIWGILLGVIFGIIAYQAYPFIASLMMGG